ncbi:MAG: hypothetical protein HY644_01925 [Acidobacteria bacterium]|nr:hypothetical protein [Acidobacteriota bacterium]
MDADKGIYGQGGRRLFLTIAVVIFVVALVARVLAYNFVWPNVCHTFIGMSASAAVGVNAGGRLTVRTEEIQRISSLGLTARHLNRMYNPDASRLPLWEVEPGLSLVLVALWKLTGVYDLRPLIWLQIICDSFLCAIFFLVLHRVSVWVGFGTGLGWALFPPQIQFACTAGYDAWASFALIAVSSAMVFLCTRRLSWRATAFIMLCMSLISVVGLWTRSYVLLWPFLVAGLLLQIVRVKRWRSILVLIYIIPSLFGIIGMMVERDRLVGNPRPTRTTFWHTFWAGIGQYDNPYGIEGLDSSIYVFAQSLDPGLKTWFTKYRVVWDDPTFNMEYEKVLAKEARVFIRRHPEILLRNHFLRILRLVVPTIRMTESTAEGIGLPQWLLAAVGLLLVPLYVAGIRRWVKGGMSSLLAFISPLGYLIFALAPFYIERRIISAVLFVHIGLAVGGIQAVFEFIRSRRGNQLALAKV